MPQGVVGADDDPGIDAGPQFAQATGQRPDGRPIDPVKTQQLNGIDDYIGALPTWTHRHSPL